MTGVLLQPPIRTPHSIFLVVIVALGACDSSSSDQQQRPPAAPQATDESSPRPRDEEPAQWTMREVARRLTDGGLVVTDSGGTSIRQRFLSVEGALFRVSGSDLQVYIYPDADARKRDSDRIDPTRVAPGDDIIDWSAPAQLIASGNLLAIHLTASPRLAERVRLILEAHHSL